MPNFLDLFAGAGGLSEGFMQEGFEPVAHVEMDPAACFTLKTRAAFRWLRKNGELRTYLKYLWGKISREELYNSVPQNIFDGVLNYEISEETIPKIFNEVEKLLGGRKLDLIIGGPPCQAYSLSGRARDKNKMVGDKRNYLYRHYAEFLKRFKPEYFVFENVFGLLSAKETDGSFHFDNMRDLFFDCGYVTEFRKLSALDFGVLQNRQRIILVGGKKGSVRKGFYPDFQHVKLEKKTTVANAFADLPPLHAGEGKIFGVSPLIPDFSLCSLRYLYDMKMKDVNIITFHQARPHLKKDLEIFKIAVKAWRENKKRIKYSALPEELKTMKTVFENRYNVIAKDLPFANVITAHLQHDGLWFIYDDMEQNRSLTPREAARLQTFPDSYFFESKKATPGRSAAFRQIGNAVPVAMARAIAKGMLTLF